MKIGVIGRTHFLLDATRELIKNGHEIGFIQTCRSESFYKANEDSYKNLAEELGCPFFVGLNVESNLARFREINVDVCISMNWLTLLKRDILDSFKYGILNAHPGDLPKYKGNACPNWAILNFEDSVAITIHRMTEELDSGPYLLKDYFPMNERTYIGEVYDWLEKAIPQLFVRSIEVLKNEVYVDQNKSIISLRTYPRKPEDSRIFWGNTTRNILALIRASSKPFEGAFCFLNGEFKTHIFKASIYEPSFNFCAMPGQVCENFNGNPIVATGDGMIEIEDCVQNGFDVLGTKKNILRSLRNRLT